VKQLPREVISKDHQLEGTVTRASEALAEHRWHWTLNESNPGRVGLREYARAVGRHNKVIERYAKGWVLLLERRAAPGGGGKAPLTIQDAVRLAENSAERQEFVEVIAQESGKPIARVARGDNRHRTNQIITNAKELADRHGGDPVEHARKLVRTEKVLREGHAAEKEKRRQRVGLRLLEMSTALSEARRKLKEALALAEDVAFTAEDRELLTATSFKVRQVLDLIDLRLDPSTSGVDWDAELAKIGNDQ